MARKKLNSVILRATDEWRAFHEQLETAAYTAKWAADALHSAADSVSIHPSDDERTRLLAAAVVHLKEALVLAVAVEARNKALIDKHSAGRA